jgi:phasin family protein
MAKSPELFPDMTKLMSEFDMTKLTDQYQQFMQQYKLPGVDVDALMAGQRKNMEALTNANRDAFEAIQAVTRRQSEILKETMDEATKALEAISKSGSPPEAAAKQAELAKVAFEKALANMRELAEMVTKSHEEAGNIVNTRISQSLEEYKQLVLKLSGPRGPGKGEPL